jgi:hypothetical protein
MLGSMPDRVRSIQQNRIQRPGSHLIIVDKEFDGR